MIKKIRVLLVLLVSLLSSVFTVDISKADNMQRASVASNRQAEQVNARRARIMAAIARRKKLREQARLAQVRAEERAQQRIDDAQRRTTEAQQKRAAKPSGAPITNAAPATTPQPAANQSSAGQSTGQPSANNVNPNNPPRPVVTPDLPNRAPADPPPKPERIEVPPRPTQAIPTQPAPAVGRGVAGYQAGLNNPTIRNNEPRVVGASQREVLLLKILKGNGVEISIQDAQNLADAVLDYGGVDSVRSGIFGTILDVRKADKEYRQIRDMFTEFLLQASRKECTKAVKLFEDILKKLKKTMLHGMCADFISLTNFLHDHLLSDRIVKYRNKFLKKLNRLKMLDERIFIKGLITKVSEDDVGCLTAELCGLIIHEARNALVSKSQRSEESKLAALRTIKKEIGIFITAFAIGHYKLAKASLGRIRTTAKVHGIEEFGNKFLSHVMSFPAVNLILRNIK